MRFILIVFILSTFFQFSCKKNDNWGEVNTDIANNSWSNQGREGVFIICEGNYGSGNGSISYYKKSAKAISNDLFYGTNQRPLGDVPQSMTIFNDKGFIVVNNSGKVEVVEISNLKSITSISGLNSPRYLLPVGNGIAYLSDLKEDSITVIDLINCCKVRKFKISKPVEKMVNCGDYVVAVNWTGNEVIFIDKATEMVKKVIIVAKEPNSLVKDKNGNIWVLSSGGYMNEEYPELVKITAQTMEIEKRIVFENKQMSPTSLCINKGGDTLYYLNNDIFQTTIESSSLPTNAIIEANGRLLYRLGVDPYNSDIWVSDALDYQQKGVVFVYSVKGILKDNFPVGIIPGEFFYE